MIWKRNYIGRENPQIRIYFGNEDPGETTEVNASSSFAWDQEMDLGEIELGTFFHSIDGLVENEQFYFRISAENSAGQVWTDERGNFSAGDFPSIPIPMSMVNFFFGWMRPT